VLYTKVELVYGELVIFRTVTPCCKVIMEAINTLCVFFLLTLYLFLVYAKYVKALCSCEPNLLRQPDSISDPNFVYFSIN